MTPFTQDQSKLSMMHKVYRLVRPYGRRRLLAVMIVSASQALAQLISVAAIFPFLAAAADPEAFGASRIGTMIHALVPAWSNAQVLVALGVALLAAIVLANVCSLFAEFYRTRFIWHYAHWLRLELIRRIQSRPYSWFTTQNSSVLIKKTATDINNFATGVVTPMIDALSKMITTVLLVGVIIVVAPKIATVVGLTVAAAYITIYVGISGFRNRLSDTGKSAWRGLYQHLSQFLGGIKPARVHGVEGELIARISFHSERLSNIHKWVPIISDGPRYLLEPIIFGAVLVILLAALASGQELASLLPSLGLVAFAGYRLMPAVQMLYGHLSQISSIRFALEEVYDEFVDLEVASKKLNPDAFDTDGRTGTYTLGESIVFDHVSYIYPGSERLVLSDLSFQIPLKTSVAIVGESGAGKSTIVDLMLGLLHPTEGSIFVDGRPIQSDADARAWQNLVGYVPQDIYLTDDSITQNIAFGIADEDVDMDRVREAARIAQLDDFIENVLPRKYDTVVGEQGVQLSGGQRQRIALARAMYRNPQVLIFDEATSALDQDTEARFMDVIYGMAHSLTIIIVAHRLSTVERCDTILRLDKGRLVSPDADRA